jgi:hypothetical protein
VKAYFDRTEPYYLSKEPTFDGNPVEVPAVIFDILDSRKATLVQMEEAIQAASAPEDSAQDLADLFVDLIEGETGG